MNWLEVQSSNVAAVAYEPEIATLTVRYKDGSVYVLPNVTATQFGALMTAPSKGKFLAAMSGQAIRIEVMPTGKVAPDSGPATTEEAGPLNVIDEDADKCCRASLARHFDRDVRIDGEPWVGSVTCRDCGTEFRAEMVGPVRHWRIVEHIAIVRPRG
jgi:hypothetical protein